jgi:hypothetical protein
MADATILWLAVDEARGHLMRAHLVRRLLADHGIAVDIATTSERGRDFLGAFGDPALVLRGEYRLAYDPLHNLEPRGSARALGRYAASPLGLARDLAAVHRWAHAYDLVVDDSFHPALVLGGVSPALGHRLVHVYGQHLPYAVEATFRQRFHRSGPTLVRAFRRACASAHARVEHTLDLERPGDPSGREFRLPPLIAAPGRSRARVREALGVAPARRLAVVYLNPRFSDPALAHALIEGLERRKLHVHAIGEGLPRSSRWHRWDRRLTDVIAAADVLVAGAGMGALGHVAAFGVPFVALASRQPEQARNLDDLARCARVHAVVDVNDRPGFPASLDRALVDVVDRPRAPLAAFSPVRAQRAWAATFERLVAVSSSPTPLTPA